MSFASDIEKWARKAGVAADRVPALVCLKLSESVIADSPVDTGRFKGNWQATIGSPASSTLDAALDPAGAATLAKANIISQAASGNIFYLVNNLPYARKLEYGHSKQAPAGVVRINVQRFREAVAEAAREVNK